MSVAQAAKRRLLGLSMEGVKDELVDDISVGAKLIECERSDESTGIFAECLAVALTSPE